MALNELHLVLGDARVRVQGPGAWSVDSSDAWHWQVRHWPLAFGARVALAKGARCACGTQHLASGT